MTRPPAALRPTLPHFIVELRRFTRASGRTAQQTYSRAKISKASYFNFIGPTARSLPSERMLKSIIQACAPDDVAPEDFWAREGARWLTYRRAIPEPDAGRRWLLIIEDQIGQQLARLFGEHQCVVIGGLEEFWAIQDQVQMFDAVLVDLHLQPEMVDKEGYRILAWLAQHTAVPTVAMTAATPQGTRVDQVIDSFNLIAFCTKSDSMDAVHEAVTLALSGEAQGLLLDRLEQSLVARRRRAQAHLRFHQAPSQEYARLDDHIERIRAACRGGSLEKARAQLREFDTTYSTPPV